MLLNLGSYKASISEKFSKSKGSFCNICVFDNRSDIKMHYRQVLLFCSR